MSRQAIVFLLAIYLLMYMATAACYFPNGIEQTNPAYLPCSNDTTNPLSTICCASWDTCLPNGLCQNNDLQKTWRESCTKSNWDNGGCQELCSNERELQRGTDIRVTPCEGDTGSLTWCCGASDDCCTAGSGIARYTIAARFGDPIPTVLPSSSVSSSSTVPIVSATPSSASSMFSSASSSGASTSSSPSASNIAAVAANSGLSTGARAGVGIGVSLGAIALVGLGIFIYKAMQWRKRARLAAPAYEVPEEYAPKEVYGYRYEGISAQLPGMESAVHEMPGTKIISELHAASPRR